jgi:hypothetical protein
LGERGIDGAVVAVVVVLVALDGVAFGRAEPDDEAAEAKAQEQKKSNEAQPFQDGAVR